MSKQEDRSIDAHEVHRRFIEQMERYAPSKRERAKMALTDVLMKAIDRDKVEGMLHVATVADKIVDLIMDGVKEELEAALDKKIVAGITAGVTKGIAEAMKRGGYVKGFQ